MTDADAADANANSDGRHEQNFAISKRQEPGEEWERVGEEQREVCVFV